MAPAAGQVGQPLPPGVIVVTGPGGRTLLKLAEGLFVELQPESQIIFAGVTTGAVVDEGGKPLPQVSITLASGSLVLVSTPEALAQTSLLVATPRGNLSPVNSGQLLISADSADPGQAAVTVAVVKGDALVTQTGGETTPVGEGLAVTLKADGLSTTGTLADLPQSPAYTSTVQSTVAKVESLELTSPLPTQTFIQPTSNSEPSPSPTPTPRPRPTPSPTPIPTPIPTPTPSPTQTP